MIYKSISFIHKLRVYFLIVVIIGFFAAAGIDPIDVGVFYGAKFGLAVGMSTSVADNPFNKLALDLKNKENDLSRREAALDTREALLSERYGQEQAVLLRTIAAGIVFLFILIIINFIFDYQSRKNEKNTA